MSVLVFAESYNGQFKKSSFEAVSYARRLADLTGSQVKAVTFEASEDKAAELGQYGAQEVVSLSGNLSQFDSSIWASALASLADSATHIVISNTPNGKAIAPRVAVKTDAGIVSNVIELPELGDQLAVKKSVFSGKGFGHYNYNSDKQIIAIQPNAIGIERFDTAASVSTSSFDSSSINAVTVKSVNTEVEGIPLPEAELVVSGGRGLKGPENWTMIEELASLLGAATACSRPVADTHWRPHHEHVGQTGVAIRPNLYIAIGISGAIQHLAGVNQSKVIVVVNKDAEAPFFKAADYGIVGDAFDVVPKLIESYKASNS